MGRTPEAVSIGPADRFEAFFERHLESVLAVLLALTGDVEAARRAAVRVFLGVQWEWSTAGASGHPEHQVLRSALARARRRVPAGEPAGPDHDFWQRVRSLPREHAEGVALTIAGGLDAGDAAQVLDTDAPRLRTRLFQAQHTMEGSIGGEFHETAAAAGAAIRSRVAGLIDLEDLDRAAATRRRRSAVIAGGVGLALVAAVFVGSLLAPDGLVAATTLPDIPDPTAPPTSVIAESPPTTTGVPGLGEPSEQRVMIGDGWEELGFGPLTGGRYRMAVAWTGSELFLWGGDLLEPPENGGLPPSEFLQDGYLFDPAADRWRPLPEVPDDACHFGDPVALVVDGDVLLYGPTSPGECAHALLYESARDSWVALHDDFFRDVSDGLGGDALAQVGGLVAAPNLGRAYDLGSGETVDIPTLRGGFQAGDLSSAGNAIHAVVLSSHFSWTVGDLEWFNGGSFPVAGAAHEVEVTEAGLTVLGDDLEGAHLQGGIWVPADIPLRNAECEPQLITAATTPVVGHCSGIAVWDRVGGFWVPVPLDDLTGGTEGRLVGTNDALYSVGRHFRRFPIERNADGSIVLPPTLAVGIMQMTLPTSFNFRLVDSWKEPDGTLGLEFDRLPGRSCSVIADYGNTDLLPQPSLFLDRPGRSPLEVIHLGGGQVAIEVSPAELIRIECRSYEDARALAAGLWHPGEPLPPGSDATVVVTPAQGPVGTAVFVRAEGLPSGWSSFAMVDSAGNPVIVNSLHDDFHFADIDWAFEIDRTEVPGMESMEIPPGEYRFVVDGRVIEGATFTKTERTHPWVEIVEVYQPVDALGRDERTIDLLHRGSEPLNLGGWTMTDETNPGWEFEFPASTRIGAGGRLTVLIRYMDCETSTEELIVCGAVHGAADSDSYALRAPDGTLVDRRIHSQPCPWEFQPAAPMCGFALFDDVERRARYQVPAYDANVPVEWHITRDWLTATRWEVVSFATYPMRSAGGNFPTAAVEDLGPFDAFVSVQRPPSAGGGPALGVFPRPEEFTYEWIDENPFGFFELDRADADALYVRWFPFSDLGATYLVVIALGDDAVDGPRADELLDILNALDFDPR